MAIEKRYEHLPIAVDLSLSGLRVAGKRVGPQSRYELHVGPLEENRARVLGPTVFESVEVIVDPSLAPYEWFLRGVENQKAVGAKGP